MPSATMAIIADFCRFLPVLGGFMGKMQQRKGRRGEEELAGILAGYGYDVHRGASQNYGTEPDLSGLAGVHIEVKRQENLRLYEALEQSERDSIKFDDGVPCVIHRRSRKPWVVSMKLADWLKLYGGSNE